LLYDLVLFYLGSENLSNEEIVKSSGRRFLQWKITGKTGIGAAISIAESIRFRYNSGEKTAKF